MMFPSPRIFALLTAIAHASYANPITQSDSNHVTTTRINNETSNLGIPLKPDWKDRVTLVEKTPRDPTTFEPILLTYAYLDQMIWLSQKRPLSWHFSGSPDPHEDNTFRTIRSTFGPSTSEEAGSFLAVQAEWAVYKMMDIQFQQTENNKQDDWYVANYYVYFDRKPVGVIESAAMGGRVSIAQNFTSQVLEQQRVAEDPLVSKRTQNRPSPADVRTSTIIGQVDHTMITVLTKSSLEFDVFVQRIDNGPVEPWTFAYLMRQWITDMLSHEGNDFIQMTYHLGRAKEFSYAYRSGAATSSFTLYADQGGETPDMNDLIWCFREAMKSFVYAPEKVGYRFTFYYKGTRNEMGRLEVRGL